jgi:hypothetical protein
MALFLFEFSGAARSRDDVRPLLERVTDVVGRAGGELIEAQVPTDLQRVYAVVERDDEPGAEAALHHALAQGGVPAQASARVRLLGATLAEVKASRGAANYLVEWDFPASLTMDAYLARKKANAPRYAEVPEVRFLRTYVCEDMSKCVCFYLAHDEAAVRRAREAVGAPVTRLSPLADLALGTGAAGAAAPAGATGAVGAVGGHA